MKKQMGRKGFQIVNRRIRQLEKQTVLSNEEVVELQKLNKQVTEHVSYG